MAPGVAHKSPGIRMLEDNQTGMFPLEAEGLRCWWWEPFAGEGQPSFESFPPLVFLLSVVFLQHFFSL